MCIEMEVDLRGVLGGVWILTNYIWKSQGTNKNEKREKKEKGEKTKFCFSFLHDLTFTPEILNHLEYKWTVTQTLVVALLLVSIL